MATGQLVPHVLPSGKTVMVPDYLLPKQGGGALALPSAPKPSGPDMRVAGPGGGGLAGMDTGGDLDPAVVEDMRQQSQIRAMREKLMPKAAAPAAPTKEHARPASRFEELGKLGGKKSAASVDPSTLAIGAPRQANQPAEGDSEDMDPMVRKVFNESLRPRGGGGPRRAPGLEVGSMKVEREPGRELLPEYKWALGLEARPDLGQEIDPDAQQPTWGDEDPVMRERRTPLERGASMAGEGARSLFERQTQFEQEARLAQRAQLAEESALIDQNLQVIADRRKRIAELQDIADRRMQEAETTEPRTKSEIWESKGGAANIFALLAIAIGGYAQGLGRNGGKNPGWDMINGALDDEVEAERDRAERRYKVGMNAKNDVERAMATYGDLDAAMLESKNRKLANVMAMTQEQIADRATDAMAKERAVMVYEAAKEAYLANKQQLFDTITGKVTKEEVNYRPGVVTGGGGAAPSTLKALEDAARAKKAISTIAGEQTGYARSIEGDKLNDVNAAMEAIDAADAVERDIRALGAAGSDFDDPLSGPLDAAAKVIGTGGDGRRRRQSLEANTSRLARGIQQSLGKSDNDAKLADQMAVGDGSGLSRVKAAATARRQALGRIQTATAGMTPQQREAFLQALPPERREQVREAMSATASPRRAASEAPIE